MIDSEFFHPVSKPILYRHYSFMQITGLNFTIQNYIKQVIEWTVTGHRYTARQNEDLDYQELKWVCCNKEIGKSSFEYISLRSREDLLFHLSPKKGTLLSAYLQLIEQQVEVSVYLEEINTILEQMTECYNHLSNMHHIDLIYEPQKMKMKDINSNYLDVLINRDNFLSLELMSNESLVEEALKILCYILEYSEKNYLLITENLGTFINYDFIEKILENLYNLSKKYSLNIISFSTTPQELLIKEDLVEAVLICNDRVMQLDDYLSLEQYIERNYPTNYCFRREDLLQTFRNVIPYLLSNKGNQFLHESIDLIMFILLNEGMGFEYYINLKENHINQLERNFIQEKLYKLP